MFFLFFTASVWLWQPGPTLVPGVFLSLLHKTTTYDFPIAQTYKVTNYYNNSTQRAAKTVQIISWQEKLQSYTSDADHLLFYVMDSAGLHHCLMRCLGWVELGCGKNKVCSTPNVLWRFHLTSILPGSPENYAQFLLPMLEDKNQTKNYIAIDIGSRTECSVLDKELVSNGVTTCNFFQQNQE